MATVGGSGADGTFGSTFTGGSGTTTPVVEDFVDDPVAEVSDVAGVSELSELSDGEDSGVELPDGVPVPVPDGVP
ncbi:hypothetical protein [Gordonia alkanivorans]|uniref:hypothetical protein n=1 Tax=Gordonia alkanivorans TaxID=84096 RepID=UPI00244C2815|nr:hypothetical protein [Gordonia alkanivorans]MDH3007533.1 hypothetical protein [Gordonia alkanivorans]MDH3013728.1 hypothetical protein [Gordonia alkanivorans]MDH3022523.1 hypothetical protein [Gordonia alkanivorans]MDH3049943.1 hypothetical protein [Gordonia alkanivorans]MDJ0028358.1 hypothetical protein [Gordonia alkanivorans]